MKEFDIFVPLLGNDGTVFGASLYQELQERLLADFDGLTFFPQRNKGLWKMGGVLYEDDIVIYRVLSAKPAKARRTLSAPRRKKS